MEATLTFSPEFIGGLLGAIVAFLFARFPELNTWYYSQPTGKRSLIMIAALLVILVIIILTGVFGLVPWVTLNGQPMVWTPFPWKSIFYITFYLLGSNQLIYLITPTAKEVKALKANKTQIVPPVGYRLDQGD